MTTKTEMIRADEVRLNDLLVLNNDYWGNEPEYEILVVTSLRLVGDDVEIGTIACPERVTTSMGNLVAILPRSVLARLGE